VAAAASLAGLDEAGMRYALSYAAQQVQAFGAGYAMPSTSKRLSTSPAWALANGVTAAIMVKLGFTGVWDVLDGEHNALDALSVNSKPEEMVAGLGSRFFVTETAIKPFSVGYPIQAPLDAFLTLHRVHGLNESNVESIVVRLPEDGARIVNDRSMPDVNCQHIIALALVDGDVSFEDSHSYERMADPKVRARRSACSSSPTGTSWILPRRGAAEWT
jgi:2-methylcitrate dehydratase PrpD